MGAPLSKTIAETCSAIRRYHIPLFLDGKPILPKDPKFAKICRDEFLSAAQYQQTRFGKECLWRAKDVKTIYERLLLLGLRSKEGSVSALFLRNLSHYAAYDSSGNIKIGIRQCRMASKPHLEHLLDHEAGHHYDDKLLFSLFPSLRRWAFRKPNEQKHTAFIQAYFDLFRRQLLEKNDAEMRQALEDLFFLSKIDALSPEKRAERIYRISVYLAEVLRFGEEIFDDRLNWLVLEKDFTMLFKMSAKELNKAKEERSDVYLEHCLVAAGLEEAGVMEIFKKRQDLNPATFSVLERRHIDLFRLLIRAASKYFPVVGEAK